MKGQIQTHQNDFDRVKYESSTNEFINNEFLYIINISIRFELNDQTTSDITDIKKKSSKLRLDPIYASD